MVWQSAAACKLLKVHLIGAMAWKRSFVRSQSAPPFDSTHFGGHLSMARAFRAHLPGGLPANAERASWTYSRGKSRVLGRCLWDRRRGRTPVNSRRMYFWVYLFDVNLYPRYLQWFMRRCESPSLYKTNKTGNLAMSSDVRCVRTVRLGSPNTALLPYKTGSNLQRLFANCGRGIASVERS